ncbi:MAG: hypothetical protein HC840_31360 [Leptolyngbyaceae cyanobacterium RM2_2_4]|nr:hypothetical protein [Leptolyngbyaceae cyanobacterium RM2_2_4]
MTQILMHPTLKPLRQIVILLAAVLFCTGCAQAYLPSIPYNPWQPVALSTDATLSDVSFTDDLDHGWLVGKNSTLLETFDAGQTWQPRTLELDEGQAYSFTSVSFSGQEGWVVGSACNLAAHD